MSQYIFLINLGTCQYFARAKGDSTVEWKVAQAHKRGDFDLKSMNRSRNFDKQFYF